MDDLQAIARGVETDVLDRRQSTLVGMFDDMRTSVTVVMWPTRAANQRTCPSWGHTSSRARRASRRLKFLRMVGGAAVNDAGIRMLHVHLRTAA